MQCVGKDEAFCGTNPQGYRRRDTAPWPVDTVLATTLQNPHLKH